VAGINAGTQTELDILIHTNNLAGGDEAS
jgi:hypothetical protein